MRRFHDSKHIQFENNVTSQWLCSNSCTQAQDVHMHELPQTYYGDNREDTLFS